MTDLIAQPQVIAEAAANVAGIRSAITTASASAAGQTTGLAAAAADEVSAAIANMFGAYGQDYQALVGQAAAFHEQFVAALAGAANAYAGAEAAAANTLGSLLAPAGPQAAANITLVMGGSGTPIPSIEYINNVVSRYIASIPGFDPLGVQGLFTPEGGYPLFGASPKDLTFNVSVQRGVEILNNQLVGVNPPYAGLLNPVGTNTVNVLGYSQSAIIASLEMRALNPTNSGAGGSPYFNFLNFSLIGDPMNPNGGLLARFAPLTLPSLGLTFYGATPDNAFPTTVTTLEYDGFADFPQYPINFLSDLNAFAGILYVHGTYPTLTAAQLGTAIHLTNTVGPTSTNYYMIPTEHLPLLNPVRSIPVIGGPIANLVEPDLRVLVNIGYGNTTHGWSDGPPNVHTPFGVIPPVTLPEVASALNAGTQEGITAFMHDINGMGGSAQALSFPLGTAVGGVAAMPALLSGISTAATASPINSLIDGLQSANTTAVNFVTNATASLYAAALPTADIANFLVTTLPSYDVNLFLTGIEQMVDGDPTGGFIYALGAPIAADVALFTLAGGFELEVLLRAVEGIVPS